LTTVTTPPTTVDEYIDGFPAEVRAILHEIRAAIRAAVPEAAEKISYQMPAYTVDGRNFVYFGAWAHHVSVYPIPTGDAAFLADIAPFRAGKGTLRFPLDQPVPYDLIGRAAALLAQQRAQPPE
jgi:uncharacterized protein YdhG (YjbR/CyaY superfamily)